MSEPDGTRPADADMAAVVKSMLDHPVAPYGFRPPPGWEIVPQRLWGHIWRILTAKEGSPERRHSVSVLRRWKRTYDRERSGRRIKSKRKMVNASKRKNRR